jgi:hypothetical protein
MLSQLKFALETKNKATGNATHMLLHGIFPPITTSFYPDGNLYFKKLEANVERYSKTPVAGIVALGSTGQIRSSEMCSRAHGRRPRQTKY